MDCIPYIPYIVSAVFAYLISGLNPSIIMSNAIYKKDIRTLGSKNPGFTNFKRVFGARYAWLVFTLDIFKGALVSILSGGLFIAFGENRQIGVAFAGLFAMLGHDFPIYYGFKGGKGFLVCLSTLWFIDPLAGLIGSLVLVTLLLSTKYMSLSTMCALSAGALAMSPLGVPLPAVLIYSLCVLFMIFRHTENIKRLIKGEERKFDLFKREKQTSQTEEGSKDSK